ncbi:MAG: hypothetical protein A2V88_07605 [Elusimicrobia bacterium RBG_16_66_12]|nr:MAG: hypothetical protein A2V88_07605 [Elusimicrobia bacterium RBG_16_66_12]
MAAGRVEEETLDAGREARRGQELGKIVDEMRAALVGDARELARQSLLEVGVLEAEAGLRPQEAATVEPSARRRVKVVGRAPDRAARAVADDARRDAAGAAGGEELASARESLRLRHSRSVDPTLKLSPIRLASLGAQTVADLVLERGGLRGDQPPRDRRAVEDLVVADEGVVEVEADEHRQPEAPALI